MKEEEIAACNYVDNHLDNDGFYDAFLAGVRWQKAKNEAQTTAILSDDSVDLQREPSICPKCHGLGEIQITTDNRFTCTKCCGTGTN